MQLVKKLSWGGGVVGRSFYVSSEEGNDNNTGTTADKPLKTLNKINEIMKDFKPGDKILLKRGSKFNNQSLHIKDISGAENKPITFMDYGDPSKPAPLIAANGVKDSQWHCLLYTSPSPRDRQKSRMPSSA